MFQYAMQMNKELDMMMGKDKKDETAAPPSAVPPAAAESAVEPVAKKPEPAVKKPTDSSTKSLPSQKE
ncbi:hypothetical protein COOONC_22901, partial [Cooperia oncophora]